MNKLLTAGDTGMFGQESRKSVFVLMVNLKTHLGLSLRRDLKVRILRYQEEIKVILILIFPSLLHSHFLLQNIQASADARVKQLTHLLKSIFTSSLFRD